MVLQLKISTQSSNFTSGSHLGVLHSFPTIFTHNSFELFPCVGRLVLLHVLRGVEDLAAVGAGVLLPHLVDHVLVGPQTHLVPELLHADVAVLPVPLSQVGGFVPGQSALRDGNVTAGVTDQGVLPGMVGSEVVLTQATLTVQTGDSLQAPGNTYCQLNFLDQFLTDPTLGLGTIFLGFSLQFSQLFPQVHLMFGGQVLDEIVKTVRCLVADPALQSTLWSRHDSVWSQQLSGKVSSSTSVQRGSPSPSQSSAPARSDHMTTN